jgi:hypothetical protein
MRKIGVIEELVEMVFFKDVKSSILFNGRIILSFSIKRGVKQSCTLAPYPFLFVG